MFANEQDVVEAVRHTRERALRVKSRGGGHSITGSAVRDGSLIDFSDFLELTIDIEARPATVTPSCIASDFNDVPFHVDRHAT